MTLRRKAGQNCHHDIRCVPADTAFVLAASLVLFAWPSKMFFELRLNLLQQNVHFVGLGIFRGQWKELLQRAPEARLDRRFSEKPNVGLLKPTFTACERTV
jgi:hypothetical protein